MFSTLNDITDMPRLSPAVKIVAPSPANNIQKELKRPDLQGEFLCSCGKLFGHAPSLNRHRIRDHNTEIECQICMRYMRKGETVKEHFLHEHGLDTFTCSCCAWSFKDKREFNSHLKSMKATGRPGPTLPIAKGPHAPGALSQEEQRRKRSSSIGQSSSSDESGSVSPNGSDSENTQLTSKAFTALLNHFIALNEAQRSGSRKRKRTAPIQLAQCLATIPEEPAHLNNALHDKVTESVFPVSEEEVVQKRVKISVLQDKLLFRALNQAMI